MPPATPANGTPRLSTQHGTQACTPSILTASGATRAIEPAITPTCERTVIVAVSSESPANLYVNLSVPTYTQKPGSSAAATIVIVCPRSEAKFLVGLYSP